MFLQKAFIKIFDKNNSIQKNIEDLSNEEKSIIEINEIIDFIKIHIKPHPGNSSILTWDDGEQEHFGSSSTDI